MSLGCKSHWYGLHEVYYNDDGVPETYATNAEDIGDTLEDLVDGIQLMLTDAERNVEAHKNKKKMDGKYPVIMKDSDFEKGGIYYAAMKAFESEADEIDTLSVPQIFNERDTKNTRRK